MMSKFTVGILGLGNIGMLYDYDHIDNENFLSHAKSFFSHPDFELEYLIDIDKNKIKLAQERYGDGVKILTALNEIDQFPDVFVLASTPDVNVKVFNDIKSSREIKLFVLEKPFWNSNLVYSDLEKYSEKCVVNYFRRYIPLFTQIKAEISSEALGKPIGAHLWYSKGLRNNGSHLIDFVNYLFGGHFSLNSIKIINRVDDYKKDDLSVSFSIEYFFKGERFPVIFQTANEKHFSLIEMDILLEKSRFRFFDFGETVEIYKVEKDPLFANYKNLIPKEIRSADTNKYGYYMCDYVSNLLKDKADNISSLKNEYEIYKVIDSVKREMKK